MGSARAGQSRSGGRWYDRCCIRSRADGEALFERLRTLRKRLADTQGLPPYVIFHDSTLREIVQRKPQTLQEFAGIRGVGEGKLARYGPQFIAALREL